MLNHLSCQPVQKIRVIVVADVVVIHQASNEVVLQPLLNGEGSVCVQLLPFIGPKVLDQNLGRHRL